MHRGKVSMETFDKFKTVNNDMNYVLCTQIIHFQRLGRHSTLHIQSTRALKGHLCNGQQC